MGTRKKSDQVVISKATYSVTLKVGFTFFTSKVELAGEPLVGDEVVVINGEGMVGLIVNVVRRSWSSQTGELTLVCKHDYVVTEDRLRQLGWG
jgi:hypothetical protein